MSDVVIRAEGLGKKYLIGHKTDRERYSALRDVLAQTAKDFARSAHCIIRGRQLISGNEIEEFWALEDVSFDINRGEIVSVIGRNGAGKSTLLKILSRITQLTTGRAEIRGRVASLLEIGTGFHPELTGRENVLLNGAILGMTRAEVRRKFDEIIDFAGVEKFIDTPVKRYSSGMYVRLAFSVAAHLEPDILIVDEVLAVGDTNFQKRAAKKFLDLGSAGRTVLLVTHNLNLAQQLSTRAVLLKSGKLLMTGSPDAIIREFLGTPSYLVADFAPSKDAAVYVTHAQLSQEGSFDEKVDLDKPCRVSVGVGANTTVHNFCVELSLRDAFGNPIAFVSSSLAHDVHYSLDKGSQKTISLDLGPLKCASGRYSLDISLGDPGVQFFDQKLNAVSFDNTEKPAGPNGWFFQQRGAGALLLPARFEQR